MTDDRDRSDRTVVTYQPQGRASRRAVFEPHDGPEAEWIRYEQARDHTGSWHDIGSELVTELTVEAPPEVLES
jgi:hypothetical protein